MSAGAVLALLVVAQAPPAWHFGVRVDPIVTVVASGASLGVSAGADAMPEDSHWRASVAAFHAEVPELLNPLVVSPSSGVHITEDALQAGAFYDVDADPGREGHRGFFFGPELYVYALTYTLHGEKAHANEAYAHATAGYTWFPWDGLGLFVEPWATLGVPVFHTGGAVVDGRTLSDRPLNWHATLSVGFRFL